MVTIQQSTIKIQQFSKRKKPHFWQNRPEVEHPPLTSYFTAFALTARGFGGRLGLGPRPLRRVGLG